MKAQMTILILCCLFTSCLFHKKQYIKEIEEVNKLVEAGNLEEGGQATVFLYEGNLDQALPLLFEADSLYLITFGKEHEEYGAHLNNLALAYHMSGDYPTSLITIEQSLSIAEKTKGKNNIDYCIRLNTKATTLFTVGRYQEAFDILQIALEIAEQFKDDNPIYYYTNLNNLLVYPVSS